MKWDLRCYARGRRSKLILVLST